MSAHIICKSFERAAAGKYIHHAIRFPADKVQILGAYEFHFLLEYDENNVAVFLQNIRMNDKQ